MSKKLFNLLLVAAFGAILLSCTNKELEERVAKLEGQVAELTAQKTPGKTLPKKPVVQEPEVKPEGPLPAFKFPEEAHDFGTIKEGEVVEHTFSFTNTGEAPLIISSATATCGCTVPVWPKEPIPVGEDGEIKVRFNSKNKPGMQNKTITITANTYPKINKLKIKANVIKEENPS